MKQGTQSNPQESAPVYSVTHGAELVCERAEVFDRDGASLGYGTIHVGPTYVQVHVPREVLDQVLELVNAAVAQRQHARQVSRINNKIEARR